MSPQERLHISGSKAQRQALCDDLAKVALEWARVTEGEGVKVVPLSAIRDLGRELADRLEVLCRD